MCLNLSNGVEFNLMESRRLGFIFIPMRNQMTAGIFCGMRNMFKIDINSKGFRLIYLLYRFRALIGDGLEFVFIAHEFRRWITDFVYVCVG